VVYPAPVFQIAENVAEMMGDVAQKHIRLTSGLLLVQRKHDPYLGSTLGAQTSASITD
jgi:hypothetical protein